MQRIMVYGVTGSGKSTLAARIGERLGLPCHSVDDLAWEPGWAPVEDQVQRERVREVCSGERWIIDGAYGKWDDLVLARADLIVALDLPRRVSLTRLVRRTVSRIVRRTPVCNGNRETWRGAFFDRESILRWHFRSFKRRQTRMRLWATDPGFPETVLLRNRAEVEHWIAGIGS